MAELIDEHNSLVDQVVVFFFENPRSYTAEDVIEISCHGAPVVLRFCVERAIAAGARLAEPGEFTLRAYLNGRIDLPQAEAVRELIDATTLYQARVAAQQSEGSVSRRIRPLKEQLLELISLLEAGIDFAEDDISRRLASGTSARASIPLSRRFAACPPPSSPVASCSPASRLPSSGDPTSGKAACSIACSNRIAPSSPKFPAPLAISSPSRRPLPASPSD